jgi:hypothetical protein
MRLVARVVKEENMKTLTSIEPVLITYQKVFVVNALIFYPF